MFYYSEFSPLQLDQLNRLLLALDAPPLHPIAWRRLSARPGHPPPAPGPVPGETPSQAWLRLAAQLAAWRRLRPGERRMLALACLGLANLEIATRQHIEPDSVKKVLRRIYRLYGVSGRGELRALLVDWDFQRWEAASSDSGSAGGGK